MKNQVNDGFFNIEEFKKVIQDLTYDNLIVSETGTLFVQFLPKEGEETKIERLKGWLWNKVGEQMIPKYNEQFEINIKAKVFPTHIEISKLYELPKIKIKKFFSLFKWVHERL